VALLLFEEIRHQANLKPPMKSLFKKKQTKSETNYVSSRAFRATESGKDHGIDELMIQRIGKSRQEIFDLMKILKTF
jgi:hypothetical protein